jgi:hypothetical protein
MRSKTRRDSAYFRVQLQPIKVPAHYAFLLITDQAPQRQAHGGNRRRSGAKGGRLHS